VRKQITLTIDDEALAGLNKLSHDLGLSRSALLRQMVHHGLSAEREHRNLVKSDHPAAREPKPSQLAVVTTDDRAGPHLVRYVLPIPRDDAPERVKARISARNQCILDGVCRECEAQPEPVDTAVVPRVPMAATAVSGRAPRSRVITSTSLPRPVRDVVLPSRQVIEAIVDHHPECPGA